MNKILSKILIVCFLSCLLYAGYDIFLKDVFSEKNDQNQDFYEAMKNRKAYERNYPINGSSSQSDDESSNTINTENTLEEPNKNLKSESYDSKVNEFADSYNKMSNTYLDEKSKNWSNNNVLYSLASEYKRYMSALSIQVKAFYESNSNNLSDAQKNKLQDIFDKCDLAVQQAAIDGAN